MTLTLKNDDALALIPGRKTRNRFVAMLLLSMGLLLSGFQSVQAQLSYQIIPGKQNSVAGSGISDVVTVHVDPPGNVGIPITFNYLGGQQTVTTDANGNATFSFAYGTPGVASTVNINIAYGAVPLTTYVFNYIVAAGPVSIGHSYIATTISPMPADGSSQDVVVARLYDKDGNAITTVATEVRFELDFLPGDIVPAMTTNNSPPGVAGSAMTSGNGSGTANEAIASFTSTSPTGGTAHVNAKVFDATTSTWVYLTTSTGGPGPVQIDFTALPPDPTKSWLEVTTNNSPDNNSTADVVTAHLINKLGLPVGIPTAVNFGFTPLNGVLITNTNGLNQTTSNGDAAARFISPQPGDATVSATYTDNTGTTYTLYSAAPGVYPPVTTPPNPSVNVHFVSGPADPNQSYVMVTQDYSAANGASQDIITVYLFDSHGYPVDNSFTTGVSFTPTGPASIVNPATELNQTVNGSTATSQYTSNTTVPNTTVVTQITVGGVTSTLFDHTNGTPGVTPSTIHFTNLPVDLSKSYIIVTTDNAVANGSAQDVVQAFLFDANNNPITDGTVVTFTVPNGGGTAVPVNVGTTMPGCTTGMVQVAYTSMKTVSHTIVATVNGQPLQEYSGNPPVGTGNLFTTIHYKSGPPSLQNSYITTTTDQQVVGGGQDIVTATLFDVNNNPVDNGSYTIDFTVGQTGSDPVVAGTASNTGSITINASPTVNSGTIAFTSTVASTFPVSATLNGGPMTTQSGASSTPITFVSSTPVNGNPGPPVNPPPPPPPTDDPPPPSKYTVEFITHDYRFADGKERDSVTAYVTDQFGNPVHGVTIVFAFVTTPTAGTAQAGAQFVSTPDTTNPQGFTGIGVTSTVPGTVFVSATLNGTPIDGSYQTITFTAAPDVANPLTALTTIIFEALADGKQQTEVKAHVVDLQGLTMQGLPVYFAIDSGSGTIVTPQPVYTDANGDAYIFITSKTPGDVLITATVDDKKIIFGSPARVRFAPINIYVPRVFTPNNDGTNDILRPILVGIAQFHYFSIYNRWGNLIFTTQDASQGWDGTFRGVPQPVETYLWIAEGIDTNGKKIVQRGMVSLVR